MNEPQTTPELANIVGLLADRFKGSAFSTFLHTWENVLFSIIAVFILSLIAFFIWRRRQLMPDKLQNMAELIIGGFDDFVCSILGDKGRRYVPFIGTLFLYILFMNMMGFIPFIKSPTASWSTTLALALCVFFYVQYCAFKELGILGYIDHLMERPRGILAFSVVIPLLMFFLGIITEFVRPLSLSLRLRSNIWGDDLLLTFLAGFGIKGLPIYLFNSFLAIIAGIVQAGVFCLLTTIYFALVLVKEE